MDAKSFIKSMIMKIDNSVFDGHLIKIYLFYKNHKRRDFFNRKKMVLLREPISDLILMQHDDNGCGYLQYAFFDVAVRFMFIEQYYKKNDFGYSLYKKMHSLRGNYGNINESELFYERQRSKGRHTYHGAGIEQHSIEQFSALCDSVEKDGFDPETIIMADKRLININGSHRVALALYHNIEYIKTEVHNNTFHRAYSINWFWKSGFNSDEIGLIRAKMNQLVSWAKDKTGDYYCVLFPPASSFFDEIVSDISSLDPDNIYVKKWADYTWEVNDFVGFLRGIYAFDSILPANFERKIFYILNSSNIIDGKVDFRIITLRIDNPMYRLKSDNGMPESIATVRMKEAIRGRYKLRDERFTKHYIGDYSHDVIIHSSDNYISNTAFRTLLCLDKNLSTIDKIISIYQYAFAMVTEDKMSRNYPENFYIGEDFDIFVDENIVDEITNRVFEECSTLFVKQGLIVQKENSRFGKRVRILYDKFTVTMFDFMCRLPGTEGNIVRDIFLKERVLSKVYCLSSKSEFIYHCYKYIDNTTKKHHLDYIKGHISNVDISYIYSLFTDSRKLKKVIQESEK